MQDTHISIYLYQDLLHTPYATFIPKYTVLENQRVSALLLTFSS